MANSLIARTRISSSESNNNIRAQIIRLLSILYTYVGNFVYLSQCHRTHLIRQPRINSFDGYLLTDYLCCTAIHATPSASSRPPLPRGVAGGACYYLLARADLLTFATKWRKFH